MTNTLFLQWKTELELKAGFQSLCQSMNNIHVRIMCDKTIAVACVQKQGSVHSPNCTEMARTIWDFALELAVWLSIAHLLGVGHVEVDDASKMFKDKTEWALNMAVFEQIGA